MLKRKVASRLRKWKEESYKALLVTGARQIGKSFSIRELGKTEYKAFIEINLLDNAEAREALASARNVNDFLNRVSLFSDVQLVRGETLIFIDEIQEEPDIMTMVKFLVEDGRYSYAFSGSMLGTEFKGVKSFPVGFVDEITMRPLDFEEFCWAVNVSQEVLNDVRGSFVSRTPVQDQIIHEALLKNFRAYLVVGGMPEVVQSYVDNAYSLEDVRSRQQALVSQYRYDIGKYAKGRALQVREIFDKIPLQLEDEDGRFVIASIAKTARYGRYERDFLWLVNAGVALKVDQVTEPKSPLKRTEVDSRFKLFQSDVGMLVSCYPQSTARAIYLDQSRQNLGSIFENAIAQELVSLEIPLYYFMEARKGEIDFLIEGKGGNVIPIEVKSGRNFRTHAALSNLLESREYKVKEGIVLCKKNLMQEGKVLYLPYYMSYCLDSLTEKASGDFELRPVAIP